MRNWFRSEDGSGESSPERPVSSASSQTTISVMASGTRPSIEKIDKEKEAANAAPSESNHGNPEIGEGEPTGGLQREELEKARDRSTFRSVILVATCTIGMILNVRFP